MHARRRGWICLFVPEGMTTWLHFRDFICVRVDDTDITVTYEIVNVELYRGVGRQVPVMD